MSGQIVGYTLHCLSNILSDIVSSVSNSLLWYEAFISEHNIYHNNSILCSELTSERIILSECTYLFSSGYRIFQEKIQIKILDIWYNDTWSMNRHLLHIYCQELDISIYDIYYQRFNIRDLNNCKYVCTVANFQT